MQLPSTGIAGLATATPERMVAGARKAEIVRLKITEAGRRALAEAGRSRRSSRARAQHTASDSNERHVGIFCAA